MASCFSLQLTAHAASPVQSHACPSVGKGSRASSRTTLPQCFVFHGFFQFACALLVASLFHFEQHLMSLTFTSRHTSRHTRTHTHLSLSMQPFCSTPTLTFAVDFSFTNLTKKKRKRFGLFIEWFKAQLVFRSVCFRYKARVHSCIFSTEAATCSTFK